MNSRPNVCEDGDLGKGPPTSNPDEISTGFRAAGQHLTRVGRDSLRPAGRGRGARAVVGSVSAGVVRFFCDRPLVCVPVFIVLAFLPRSLGGLIFYTLVG